MEVTSTEMEICDSDQVPERGRLVVDVADRTVGVFRLSGELHAYENSCPHMGGPVCQGLMIPRVLENLGPHGETVGQEFDEDDLHIVCPWHGYEFSISNGRHAGTGSPRLRRFPAREEDGKVYVTI